MQSKNPRALGVVIEDTFRYDCLLAAFVFALFTVGLFLVARQIPASTVLPIVTLTQYKLCFYNWNFDSGYERSKTHELEEA